MKNLINAVASIVIVLFFLFLLSCKKEEANKNPEISSVTVSPTTPETNSQASVTVVASDPDGDQLTYNYTVSGGTIQGNGASAVWSMPSQANSYSVTAKVDDGKGGNSSFNAVIEVVGSTTQLTGTASFTSGTSGDLADAKVSIYTSLENWDDNLPFETGTVIGSGNSVTFTFTDLTPGNYYLDVWKDNDNNSEWSVGDFLGWYGSGGISSPNLTEIEVLEGDIANVNLDMFIIESPVTSIVGTAAFENGTTYDLVNSKASLYTSYENWSNYDPDVTVTVIGSGNSVTFEFPDIDPGIYYLDVWKDIDLDNLWSDGDYVGWYGDNNYLFEIIIDDGEVLDFDITMYIIEEKRGNNKYSVLVKNKIM